MDDTIPILYTCKPISLKENVKALSSLILKEIGLSPLSFDDINELFSFLSNRREQFVIAIDENQDLYNYSLNSKQ